MQFKPIMLWKQAKQNTIKKIIHHGIVRSVNNHKVTESINLDYKGANIYVLQLESNWTALGINSSRRSLQSALLPSYLPLKLKVPYTLHQSTHNTNNKS